MLQWVFALRCLYFLKLAAPWRERIAFTTEVMCDEFLWNSFGSSTNQLLSSTCDEVIAARGYHTFHHQYNIHYGKGETVWKVFEFSKFSNSPNREQWRPNQKEEAGNRRCRKPAPLLKEIYVDPLPQHSAKGGLCKHPLLENIYSCSPDQTVI